MEDVRGEEGARKKRQRESTFFWLSPGQQKQQQHLAAAAATLKRPLLNLEKTFNVKAHDGAIGSLCYVLQR